MTGQATFLVLQFLRWVEERPRRHADLAEAWQSTCPLNSAWEDAMAEGLVTYGETGALALTGHGKALLASARERSAAVLDEG